MVLFESHIPVSRNDESTPSSLSLCMRVHREGTVDGLAIVPGAASLQSTSNETWAGLSGSDQWLNLEHALQLHAWVF